MPVDENGKIYFRDPTIFPQSLDELYHLLETGEGNWTFTEQPEMKEVHVHWWQVKEIQAAAADDHGQGLLIAEASKLADILTHGGIAFPKQGKLVISEADLFGLALLAFIQDDIRVCAVEGNPTVYGPGLIRIFIRLEGYIR